MAECTNSDAFRGCCVRVLRDSGEGPIEKNNVPSWLFGSVTNALRIGEIGVEDITNANECVNLRQERKSMLVRV